MMVPAASAAPPYMLAATDNLYGPMPWLKLDYSASKKDPGTRIITNPAANPRLTSYQLSDLTLSFTTRVRSDEDDKGK